MRSRTPRRLSPARPDRRSRRRPARAPAAVGEAPRPETVDRPLPAAPAEETARAHAPALEAQPPRRTQPAAAPKPAAAPPPAPPQVLIDRIDVITPPAAPPAPDLFASLAVAAHRRVAPRRRALMAGITAIQGVDDTLKKLTTDAVASLSPKPEVTVGPLDRDSDELRLNWFLYRIGPNAAYRNMEPPATGWRTAYGRPPLALTLHYLLTAFPSSATNGGDQEQFAHAALAAAMQALHGNAIVGESDPKLSPLAKPLVEPLRITPDSLDLEALSKLWTATTQPLRLSIGYEVSLVVVDAARCTSRGRPCARAGSRWCRRWDRACARSTHRGRASATTCS
jgi:hypothetical protein